FLPRSRDPNCVVPRLRLHDAGADGIIFRPLFGNAFRDANRIGLLDLTALGDGHLPRPDLFTSRRNPDGVVPRLRLHDAGLHRVVFRPLLGYALGNSNRIGLLDGTTFRDWDLLRSDFLTAGGHANGVVSRFRPHLAYLHRVIFRPLLGHAPVGGVGLGLGMRNHFIGRVRPAALIDDTSGFPAVAHHFPCSLLGHGTHHGVS